MNGLMTLKIKSTSSSNHKCQSNPQDSLSNYTIHFLADKRKSQFYTNRKSFVKEVVENISEIPGNF